MDVDKSRARNPGQVDPQTRGWPLVSKKFLRGLAIGSIESLAFASLISSATPAAQSQEGAPVPELELIATFDVPKLALESTPRDIRWAAKDSVYIAYDRDGVREFSIGESLLEERELFPPRNRVGEKSIKNLFNLALSGDLLLAWGPANIVGWRELAQGSEIRLKELRGYFDDVDVRGDEVAILGYPNVDEYVKNGHAYLWLGDLKSDLDQWRPLRELSVPSPVKARSTFSRSLGSVRFMANGDLLVVPVVKSGVFRHGRSGKLRRSWTTEELESSLLTALGGSDLRLKEDELTYSETEPAPDPSSILKHVDSLRMVVEDVLPIGKKPAVLVRYRTVSSAGFYLGILGAEPSWFKLPIGDHLPSVRVRADYFAQSDRIALLVTDRLVPTEGANRRVYIVQSP